MGLDGTKYIVEVLNQLWVLPLEIFGSRLENYKSIKYQSVQIPNDIPCGSTSGPAIGWLHGLVRGRTNQFPLLVVLIYFYFNGLEQHTIVGAIGCCMLLPS